MQRSWNAMKKGMASFWQGLREWCGDAAYEKYTKCVLRSRQQGDLLSPTEFYVQQLNKKYSRPNRCC